MKKSLAIISVVGLAVGVSAQTAHSSNEPAGIKILRVELQRTKSKAPTLRAVPSTDPSSQAQAKADRLRDVDSNPALHRISKDAEVAPTSGSAPFGSSVSDAPIVFIASIVVKNTGARTITAVYWEYLMFEPGDREPTKRFRVRSKASIAPGEQAELTKEVNPKGKEHQALITRIEYSDGTVWQAR